MKKRFVPHLFGMLSLLTPVSFAQQPSVAQRSIRVPPRSIFVIPANRSAVQGSLLYRPLSSQSASGRVVPALYERVILVPKNGANEEVVGRVVTPKGCDEKALIALPGSLRSSTGSDGKYNFGNLQPGSYYLIFCRYRRFQAFTLPPDAGKLFLLPDVQL